MKTGNPFCNLTNLCKTNKKVWPRFVSEQHFSEGFQPEQIEKLVRRRRGYLESFPKVSPVAFWETETYSFGKTYRNWLGWPWFIPLPMTGDHGVPLTRKFSNRELHSGARTYLTWSSWRTETDNPRKLRVIQIPHPWVTYRRKRGLSKNIHSQGTLAFIPHTLQDTSREGFDFKEYIETLISLPQEFQPVSLCIQMHDVRKGLHKELAQFGLPIFTAGHTSSPFFVDRFYDLILRFNFATSNVSGSQQFYCQEAGVPYFILGKEHQEKTSLGVLQSYYSTADSDLVMSAKKLFTLDNVGFSEEKTQFLNQVLGLSIDAESLRGPLRARLSLDFLLLSPRIIWMAMTNFLRTLLPFFRNKS